MLGYSQWRRFEQAIQRGEISCRESGNPPGNHFAGAGKMVELGSGSVREVADYQLSRFACYLIAQNGDPRKPEIAHAQQYFAIQTRRQELSDQLAADVERLELRKQTSQEFKAFSALPKKPPRALHGARIREAQNKPQGLFCVRPRLARRRAGFSGVEARRRFNEFPEKLPRRVSRR